MGSAIYPHIENTDEEWVYMSGKALSRNLDLLQKLIKKDGHKDLMEYFVPSEEDLEEWGVAGEPKQAWFNPAEGLAIIDSMLRAFQQQRAQFELPDNLEQDLQSFRKILDRAAGEGRRWNLAISY